MTSQSGEAYLQSVVWAHQQVWAALDAPRESDDDAPTPMLGQPISWEDHDRISKDGP